jgi:hypothetical protein
MKPTHPQAGMLESIHEKKALCLTIPSLTGIIVAILWIAFNPEANRVFSSDLMLVVRDILCYTGVAASAGCFYVIWSKYLEIRMTVIVACYIINGIWILLSVFLLFLLGPYHMQT